MISNNVVSVSSLFAYVDISFAIHTNLVRFVKKYYSAEVLKKQTETEEKLAAIIAVKKYMEDQKLVRLPNK